MSDKINAELTINIALEVFAVLSSHTPKDALDVLRETKEAIRQKVNLRAQEIALASPGFITTSLNDDVHLKIHYDLILEILNALIKDGKAKQQTGKSGLPKFLRV